MSRNPNYQRNDRLSELFREILGETLSQIDEPDLEFVNITRVEVDNNLNRAQIYFTSLDMDPEKEESISGALERNMGTFSNALGTQSRIRQIPELVFLPDEGLKASARIEDILKGLEESQDA